MEWEKPKFTEIKMDAEIGSYQLDDGDRDVASRVEEERERDESRATQ